MRYCSAAAGPAVGIDAVLDVLAKPHKTQEANPNKHR